ncbi:hypothetical protein GDO81_020200 [Engystomops pustulosus]|uniref:Uncharacterized protein n=1 Tax=Engystomops pustulosus TaxID=76066 RepID=A0AAV6YS18_ENGPU|nr:hypothetical protein GDO81_020200 [Engystomops pustulosus]
MWKLSSIHYLIQYEMMSSELVYMMSLEGRGHWRFVYMMSLEGRGHRSFVYIMSLEGRGHWSFMYMMSLVGWVVRIVSVYGGHPWSGSV